ncbi:MAG: flagellar biosynthesis protein FliQ [Rhodospirillaceae bacterium]|jgi:flagellar biosynthesis protein FliQ|nr:flagellar biosynthesis protein FliQ [Rhodospirillaceae bacterium]MBT5666998.1 flagellar biosynthesis protein FliQ [Rhodospirillaceae bacterium]MBT5812311.1 flagellar biosynthesis protein FliQ [Rhodospirillaceae bacterium]
MNEEQALDFAREAIFTVLKIGTPIMLIALIVGLVIALFQALTQIQEMTLTFVPKILVIFLTLMLMLPYILNTLQIFMLGVADRIAAIG